MKSRRYPQISMVLKQSVPAPQSVIELTEKQKKILTTTSQVILAILILGGTITLSAIAPNAFWALELFEEKKGRRGGSRKEQWSSYQKKIRQSVYYLRRSGQIQLAPQGDNDFLMKVTKKGRNLERRLQFAELQVRRARKWDGTWWVVIADIPLEQHHEADAFRKKLKAMDFFSLQRTVWLFPFDPRDEVDLASAFYGVQQFVTYMRAFELDREDELRLKRFFRKKGII